MSLDVVHLIHQYPPESHGGSEFYLRDLVARQRANGRTVEVISGTKHWRTAFEWATDEVDGVPVHRIHREDGWFEHYSKMWHPRIEAEFAAFLRKRRPAIVHVHHWLRLTCNLVEVCRREGIPAVVTLHDYYTSCPRAFRSRPDDPACHRPIEAANCAPCVTRFGHETQAELDASVELFADHFRAELGLAATVLVAVSSTADLLSRTTGVPRERYEVLPLGYRARFAGLPQLPAPAHGAPLRFAFWGILGRHKGIHVLVEAMRRVAEQRPGRAELHLFGGFDSVAFEQEIHSMLAEREVAAVAAGPITLHGRFESAQLHAAGMHVGVFPSICLETYGQVLDECFELGLPCILTSSGALAERSAGAGLLVDAGCATSLAAAMLRMIDEPELWHQLRARLPRKSIDRQAHAEAVMGVYERVLREPQRVTNVEPVPMERRVAYLQMQRDSALGRACGGAGPR